MAAVDTIAGPSASVRGNRIAVGSAAAIGVAATLALFWPGLMSVDSAVQFAQARATYPLDDVHPVLMSLLWRALDRVLEGPGALFLLFVLGWWGGLAAWAAQWPMPRWGRPALVLGVGLWPPTLLMLGHVWKDVGMSALLLWAAALIFAWRRRGSRTARTLALLALGLAAAFRHNAVFAALPLLLWWSWPRAQEAPRAWRRTALGAGLALLLAAAPGGLARLADAGPRHPWTVVALWDLAALSIDANAVKLPASVLAGPPLTVEELRAVFDPWANPRLFAVGKIKSSFYHDYTDGQLSDLRAAWWSAVRADPLAYLRHRARLTRYLMLGFPESLPRELIYVPERVQLPSTHAILPPVDEDTGFWRGIASVRDSVLFAGALYLGLALLAVAIAYWRSAGEARVAIVALAASAWCNALPLAFISGSAEFRYLTWSALAGLLALALAASGARRGIG